MKNKHPQLPKPPSKNYLADRKWVHKHLAEISNQYPNQWVAVFNKKIISASVNGAEAEKNSSEKLGHQEFFIFYAEKGIHVY
jgi:hypothetical protein